MAETVNISVVAAKVAEDIFEKFFWSKHPKHDQNFKCTGDHHLSDGKRKAKKQTHPTDAVFFYVDPYTGQKKLLLTDFKSYGKASINKTKIRASIRSLAEAVECAKNSTEWRTIFSVDESENTEIHGLLFLYNHDQASEHDLNSLTKEINLESIDIAAGVYVHYAGPIEINRIWSIANDILRLQAQKTLPEEYSFYYPDLLRWHRKGDEWNQPATIETLMAPYMIIRHKHEDKKLGGYLIYYNRDGSTAEEFEYFFDSLLRYQMLDSESYIRVRISHPNAHENCNSNFLLAKARYIKAWGFGPHREASIESIVFDKIATVISNYSAGQLGWGE